MGNARRASVVRVLPDRWVPCPIDQIACVLNPVQQADLIGILGMTPPGRCLAVAMAYAGIPTYRALLQHAGVRATGASVATLSRWVTGRTRWPLGAAYRVAAVFGVPAEALFAHWIGDRGC